jgi:hypothetical protein
MNRPRSFFLVGFLALALISAAEAQGAAEMPRIEGESLGGHHVALPDAASGKIAVLIFGFTKASKVPTGDWAKKVSSDFNNQAAFALYQLPVLEDVPRLIRGMVISGIRKGVPEETRNHFVPIVSGEAELKKLVSYKEPDDAYLILVNRMGKIVEQTHGPFNETAYGELRAKLDLLLSGPN